MWFRAERLARVWVSAVLIIACGLPPLAQSRPPNDSKKPAAGSGRSTPIGPPAAALPRVRKQVARAVALQNAGRYREAVTAYQEYLRNAKREALPGEMLLPAYWNLSALYHRLHDLKSQESCLKAALGVSPENPATLAQLATLCSEQRRMDQAQRYARRALALNPPSGVAGAAHFALGAVASEQNDLPTAQKEFGLAAQLSPANPQVHFNYALALYRAKRVRAALASAEKAHRLAPGMDQALLFVALCKQELGDFAGAVTAYDAALKRAPKNALALFNRAEAIRQQGKTQDAITAYQAALTVAPRDINGRMGLGRLYEQIQNYSAAHEQYAIASRLAPQNARILIAAARAESEEGLAVLDPAVRDPLLQSAETRFKEAQRLLPDDPEALTGLARMYERMGRFQEALALYLPRKQANPRDLNTYRQIARIYTMERRIPDLLALWREYRSHVPDDPASYDSMARALEGMGQFKEAIAEWRALLQRHPDGSIGSSATLGVARDLARLKQFEEARNEFRAVLALDATARSAPENLRATESAAVKADHLEALRGLARLSEDEQKPREALLGWMKVKEAEAAAGDRRHPPLAATFRALARLYKETGQPDLAVREYYAFTDAYPADSAPWVELARLQESLDRMDDSVASLRQAARRARDPVDIQLEIGELFRRHNRPEQALTEYAGIKMRYPGETRIYSPMALTYERLGKDEEALTAYNAYLQKDPQSAWANDRKAVVLVRLKRYADARKIFEAHLDSHPESYQTYADLAHAYADDGKADDYLAWLRPRVEKAPAQRTLLAALVDEYARRKQPEAGWAALQKLMERHAADRKVMETYAELLGERGKAEEALAVYRSVAARNARDLTAQLQLAEQLDHYGRKEEATQLYKALQRRTDFSRQESTRLKHQMGERYLRIGATEEAIALYREIVNANAEDYAATFSLAQLLNESGRVPEAIALYQGLLAKASEQAGARAQILVRLAGIDEKQGHRSEAIGRYQEALKLNPQDREAAAALKRLGAP